VTSGGILRLADPDRGAVPAKHLLAQESNPIWVTNEIYGEHFRIKRQEARLNVNRAQNRK
jgi:hypothetical protein